MGGSLTVEAKAAQKNVVIVGFSFGGQMLIENIFKMSKVHSITVIDKNESMEAITNMWEAFCIDDAFKTNSVTFEEVRKNMDVESKLKFVQAKLTKVN